MQHLEWVLALFELVGEATRRFVNGRRIADLVEPNVEAFWRRREARRTWQPLNGSAGSRSFTKKARVVQAVGFSMILAGGG